MAFFFIQHTSSPSLKRCPNMFFSSFSAKKAQASPLQPPDVPELSFPSFRFSLGTAPTRRIPHETSFSFKYSIPKLRSCVSFCIPAFPGNRSTSGLAPDSKKILCCLRSRRLARFTTISFSPASFLPPVLVLLYLLKELIPVPLAALLVNPAVLPVS